MRLAKPDLPVCRKHCGRCRYQAERGAAAAFLPGKAGSLTAESFIPYGKSQGLRLREILHRKARQRPVVGDGVRLCTQPGRKGWQALRGAACREAEAHLQCDTSRWIIGYRSPLLSPPGGQRKCCGEIPKGRHKFGIKRSRSGDGLLVLAPLPYAPRNESSTGSTKQNHRRGGGQDRFSTGHACSIRPGRIGDNDRSGKDIAATIAVPARRLLPLCRLRRWSRRY